MIVLLALLGLVVGSSLNVLIYRLNVPSAPKWCQGRSLCPHCKKTLSWYDNVPLLSFILLRGKCRFCHRKIGWQYPLVELITGVSFVLVGVNPPLLVLSAAFIVIFFSDGIYGLIPDEMIVVGVLATVGLGPSLVVGVFSGLALLLIVLLTRFRGMGLGDVKLAFLMGFFLGWPKILVAFWSAFILGGLVAVLLLLLNKVRLSDRMAFGPYLVLATLISALCSDKLLAVFL